MVRLVLLSCSISTLVACTQTPSTADGGTDGAVRCARDEQCSDGLYCDGVEHCAPTDPHADAQGCVAAATATAPCPMGQTCDEVADRCMPCTPATRDEDADGHFSLACGGDDCDDTDPSRYPGNLETCDTLGHDEDCDPATYGRADHDHDGHDDSRCCDGTVCGDDCDDTEASVHPGASEVCNGYDDDCNGMTDEGVLISFYVDGDDDSYGGAAAGTGCTVLSGFATRGGDCADDDPARHPGATETCNALDDDCNAMVDDGTEAACAAALGGHGGATCVASATSAVCRPTGCDMGFADCDGVASNGCEADTCNDSMQCNHCGGHCLCDGGSCVGMSPHLGFGTTLTEVGSGAPIAGATIRPLFSCHDEAVTTSATGDFTMDLEVNGVSLFRIDHATHRTHVAGSFQMFSPADVSTWLADTDTPAEDTTRGIVVIEAATGFTLPFAIDAPGGPLQILDGADVLAPGATGSGTSTTGIYFNVAPGPVTVAPMVPIGCSVTCAPVSSWVLPGAITHVRIAACSETCA